MYKVIIGLKFFVAFFIATVTSHGGHNEGLGSKNAIQDALLSYLCRGSNGLPCNGHGSCSAGRCSCVRGYSGLKCEINDADMDTFGPSDVSFSSNNVGGINLHDLLSPITDEPQIISCISNDETTCNGHGFCHEGSCLCEPGYSGLTCELSHEAGFCRTYKECAECTAFMEPCPEKCSMMAHFKLVFGFPSVTESSTFRKCRFRNSDHNCTFYFKQESENPQGMKTIMVKACLAYQESVTNASDSLEQLKDKPLQPVTSSRPTPSSVDEKSTSQTKIKDSSTEDPHKGHKHGKINETGKQDNISGDSGTSNSRPEVPLIFGLILMLHMKL